MRLIDEIYTLLLWHLHAMGTRVAKNHVGVEGLLVEEERHPSLLGLMRMGGFIRNDRHI